MSVSEKLAALDEAMTPAPWIADPDLADDDEGALHNVWHTTGHGLRAVAHDITEFAEAEGIATLRNALPALREVVEALVQADGYSEMIHKLCSGPALDRLHEALAALEER